MAEFRALLTKATFSEIVASEANFQNLTEIETFMSKLFHPSGYLDTLGKYEHDCLVPSRGAHTHLKLDDGWKANLASILERRHTFVHDANSPCEHTPTAVQIRAFRPRV